MLQLAPLVLVRHGQSQWNLEKRFTGWANVDRNEAGREEVRKSGIALHELGFRFDRAFISRLNRTRETLNIILRELGQADLPVDSDWRLNERHYGALEGMNKVEFGELLGAEKLHRLRRGYREQPPPVLPEDPRHPRNQSIYRDLEVSLLPACESLADTRERLLPYWNGAVLPAMTLGERVMIVSHGNTLRALLMHLAKLTETEVEALEIPTGHPLIVEFDQDGAYRNRYFIGAG